MDDPDAEGKRIGWVVERDGSPVPADFARVRDRKARQYFKQRTFAGLMVAQKRVNRAGGRSEGERLQRANGPVSFGDAFEHEGGRLHFSGGGRDIELEIPWRR